MACATLLVMAGCNEQWSVTAEGASAAGDTQVAADGWEERSSSAAVGVALTIPVLSPMIVSGDTIAHLDGNDTYVFNRDPAVATDYIFLIGGVFDANGNGKADPYNDPNVGYFAVRSGSRYINPANALLSMGYSISGAEHLGALARFAPSYDFDAYEEAGKDFSVHKALTVATVMLMAHSDTTIPAIETEEDNASSSAASDDASSESSVSSSSSESYIEECGDIGPCDASSSSSETTLVYLTSLDYDTCASAGGYMDFGGVCALTMEQLDIYLAQTASSSSSSADDEVAPVGGEESGSSGTIVIYNTTDERCAEVLGTYDYAEHTCVVSEEGLQAYFDSNATGMDENATVASSGDELEGQIGGSGEFPAPMVWTASARVTAEDEPTNKEKIISAVLDCGTPECLNEIVRQLAIVRNGLYHGEE